MCVCVCVCATNEPESERERYVRAQRGEKRAKGTTSTTIEALAEGFDEGLGAANEQRATSPKAALTYCDEWLSQCSF